MGCCLSCDTSEEVELFNMELISEGRVRKIYKCNSSVGELACKTIPLQTNSWKREIIALQSLVGIGDCFQQLSHVTRTETEVCIFNKFIPGHDLYAHIDTENFRENETKGFLKELVSIVFKLHQHGMWHLDIKPENIMCRDGDITDLVLIDFGHSLFHNKEKSYILPNRGTVGYSSPEQLRGVCTAKGDVWSIGATLYVAIFKEYPVDKWSEKTKELSITPLTELFSRLLEEDIDSRITISELYNHPWIK